MEDKKGSFEEQEKSIIAILILLFSLVIINTLSIDQAAAYASYDDLTSPHLNEPITLEINKPVPEITAAEIDPEREEQNFTWGVLAINVNKSIYSPNEDSFIGIGVLDEQGNMVCNASVTLEITNPLNEKTILSTENNKIKISPECEVYGVTELPDYYTSYGVNDVGIYLLNLTAITSNGVRNIVDSFIVQNTVDFDIARQGPTRIYPFVPYNMSFTINADKNYDGLIKEYVPASFTITPQSGLTITEIGDIKILSWNVNLKKEDAINLYYEFDAPDISPEFYLLGPLSLGDKESLPTRSELGNVPTPSLNAISTQPIEARQWTIASDGAAAEAYIHDFIFYYNGTATSSNPLVWEPKVLCQNQPYNLTVVIASLNDNDITDTITLQSATGVAFAAIPNVGWDFAHGDTNDKSLTVTANRIDETSFFINASQTGTFNLRSFMTSKNGFVQYNSNKLAVEVVECDNIHTANREITVKGTHGADDKMIAGSVNTITIPLFNYNASVINDVNASLKIKSSGVPSYDWQLLDDQKQQFNFSGSTFGGPSPFNESIAHWRVLVDDDAEALTYTAEITVASPNETAETFTRDFTLQDSYVVIYNSQLERADDRQATPWKKAYTTCNYGDRQVNLTIKEEFSAIYIEADPTADPPPDVSDLGSGTLQWNVTLLNTSTCWDAIITYDPVQKLPATYFFTQSVSWDSGTLSVGTEREVISRTTKMATVNTLISDDGTNYRGVREAAQNSSLTVRIRLDDTLLQIDLFNLLPTLDVPNGFSKPGNLGGDNGAQFRPGFPYGSVKEGWNIKFFDFNILIGDEFYSFDTDISAIPDITPGGKLFKVTGQGAGDGEDYPKEYRATNEQLLINVIGPYIKFNRSFYNETAAQYQAGFPSSLGCGALNVSLQIFNKGNRNLSKSNVTEFFPSGLEITDVRPINSSGGATIISWDGEINFTPGGSAASQTFNYTLEVPFGVSKNDTFKTEVTNVTFTFVDREYTVEIACGASLSVATPVFDQGGTVTSVDVNTPFNVSSDITNLGPGTATNVIAEVNVTANFTIKNSSDIISNFTDLDDLTNGQTKNARWEVNTSGVVTGSHEFCIIANATENTTGVKSCASITIATPGAAVNLVNPQATSNRTQTSTGPWGFPWELNVTVDSNQDGTDIDAWVTTDSGVTYTKIGTQTYNGGGAAVTFTYPWYTTCADLGSGYTVVFNDTPSKVDEATKTFTLQKDSIQYTIFAGDGSDANRTADQSTLLSVRVRDANGTNLTNFDTKFEITTNNASFHTGDLSFQATTNDSGVLNGFDGFANFFFNATCSGEYSGAPKFLVGEQQWKILVNDSELDCYLQNDSSDTISSNLFVFGDIGF
ncbi:hypothetical protein JYT91_01080, partial [archaeon AH-315-M20]|nr:hypothetical protein [archaeon AH-315-M20]